MDAFVEPFGSANYSIRRVIYPHVNNCDGLITFTHMGNYHSLGFYQFLPSLLLFPPVKSLCF